MHVIFRYFDISGLTVDAALGISRKRSRQRNALDRSSSFVLIVAPGILITCLTLSQQLRHMRCNGRTFRMILADRKNSSRSSRCRTKAVINSRPAWPSASRSRRDAIYLSSLLYQEKEGTKSDGFPLNATAHRRDKYGATVVPEKVPTRDLYLYP